MEAQTVDSLPPVAADHDPVRCLLAIELSKKSWIVAITTALSDKISRYTLDGCDWKGLLELMERIRTRVAIVLCVDEKPSIQALERAQGYLKLPNGRSLTGQSHDYKRHGTTTLFAALEVATGKILATHSKRRRRVEFLDFMDRVAAAFPNRPSFTSFSTTSAPIRRTRNGSRHIPM